VWKGIGGSFPTRLLQITGLSLALMTASTGGVRAGTVIGADGAAGASCVLPSDPDNPWCYGGNGGSGESVNAAGNPAVAYGGNGGPGGLGASFGSYDPSNNGFGGDGGSATAVAEESAASGAVTASAMAVGGRDGGYYYGDTQGGDATASATAISGRVSVSAMAVATGILNPGVVPGPNASAYAFAAAFPDKAEVAALTGSNFAGDIVFGIAVLDTEGWGFNDVYLTNATLTVGGYRGDLFLDVFNLGSGASIPGNGPFDETSVAVYGPGTFVLYGVVPQTSTWVMMLLGFAGLGVAGSMKAGHASRRGAGLARLVGFACCGKRHDRWRSSTRSSRRSMRISAPT